MRFLLPLFVWCLPSFAFAQPLTDPDEQQEAKEERKIGDEDPDIVAWRLMLRKLGDGPFYLVEFWHRDEKGRLYVGRSLVSKAQPRAYFTAFGLNDRGEPMDVPDPSHKQLKSVQQRVNGEPIAPLAEVTWVFGCHLESKTELDIRVTDLGTSIDLPKKDGEVTLMPFNDTLFRIERLDRTALHQLKPLRQNPRWFRAQFKAIFNDCRTIHAKSLRANVYSLTDAALVLHDVQLIAEVRKQLREWIAQPPEATNGKGFPNELVSCLERCGNPEDVLLFARLAERHPHYEDYAMYSAGKLVRRLAAK